MYLTWRQRLEQRPTLWDFGQWPVIELTVVATNKRSTYLRNRDIVIQALNHIPFNEIAESHLLSASFVTQLMNRCLAGEDDEDPPLTQALIPFQRVNHGTRREPIPTFDRPSGSQHAFTKLLREVPNLKKELDKALLAQLRDSNYKQNLTPSTFHSTFKQLLVEAGHPTDQYPYTTRHMAAESVRRYFHQRSKELQSQRLSVVPSPSTPSSTIYRALRTTQIDEHSIDLHNGIYLELNDELIPLRLSRVQVIVATNVDTDCILGFHIALSGAPNQQDMLQLLDNCVRPWEPLVLTTPGLTYEAGACFPSGLPDDFPVTFGTVQLDNALAHLAISVQEAICDQQAATISMGRGGSPTTRRWIEDVFNLICRKISHRFSSTTGSHPKDPIRQSKKNSKRLPPISLHTLEEALSIVLTAHNVSPRGQLGGTSPLELYQSHYRHHYIRFVPAALRNRWKPFVGRKTVSLKWLRYGNRKPHIAFEGQRYQGEGLIDAVCHNSRIIVEFDRRDIRWLRAWSLDGKDLGMIAAPKSWLRFRHSIATRQRINSLIKQHAYHGNDPLTAHFRYLLEHKGQEKAALEIIRVYDEFTREQDGPLMLSGTPKLCKVKDSEPEKNDYSWSPLKANRRG
jgi:hypothetical protein